MSCTREKVVLGLTYTSAFLGLDQTSKAEAEQHEVDGHSHRDDWLVLVRFCSVGGRRLRRWSSCYYLGGECWDESRCEELGPAFDVL